MYIEISSRSYGHSARLISPPINGSIRRCLVFYYHMYGGNVNTLNVYFSQSESLGRNMWSTYGSQGNVWKTATVQIEGGLATSDVTNIVFDGRRGRGYQGNIAIDDVSLIPGTCFREPPSTIRLVSPLNNRAGRIEVFHNGKWGMVCDDGFTELEEEVACRDLDMYRIVVKESNANDRIWLDEVSCNGTEWSLTECVHRPWGEYNCSNSDTVTVNCSEVSLDCTFDDNTCGWRQDSTNSLNWTRTSDGPSSDYTSGHGAYMYIETSSQGTGQTANLISPTINGRARSCLVFYYKISGSYRNSFSVFLSNNLRRFPLWYSIQTFSSVWKTATVQIAGGLSTADVKNIVFHGGPVFEGFIAIDDVSLIPGTCFKVPSIQIRLVSPLNNDVGSIEVFHNGEWGTVCDDGFTEVETEVVCRELNMNKSMTFNETSGSDRIWLDDVSCNGTESSLIECDHRPWGDHNCSKSNDVVVDCTDYNMTADFNCTFDSNTCGWAQDAGDNFDWTRRSSSTPSGPTGPGSDHTTGYGYYMYIETSPSSLLEGHKARLISPAINGTEPMCLVFYYHMYGLHINALNVYFYESGSFGGSPVWSRYRSQGNSWHAALIQIVGGSTTSEVTNIVLEGLTGDGYAGDIAIDDISLFPGNCSQGNHSTTPSTTIRLISPLNNGVGRIEVYHNGVWGTVCDDLFTDMAAKVACRQLGMYQTSFIPKAIYNVTRGSGRIWLDNVGCNGTERSLSECNHSPWGLHNCDHDEDVGVICTNTNITLPDPPKVVIRPSLKTLNVLFGDDIDMKCEVLEANPDVTSITWSHNGRDISGKTFHIKHVTKSDEGRLTCTAHNGVGSSPGQAETYIRVLDNRQEPQRQASDDVTTTSKWTRTETIAVVTGVVALVIVAVLVVVIVYLYRKRVSVTGKPVRFTPPDGISNPLFDQMDNGTMDIATGNDGSGNNGNQKETNQTTTSTAGAAKPDIKDA